MEISSYRLVEELLYLYIEVFAHVERVEIMRLVVAVTTISNWLLYNLGVKSTFLNRMFKKPSLSLNHQVFR